MIIIGKKLPKISSLVLILLSMILISESNKLQAQGNKIDLDKIINLEYTGPIEKHEEYILDVIQAGKYNEKSKLVQSYMKRMEKLFQEYIQKNYDKKIKEKGNDRYYLNDLFNSFIKGDVFSRGVGFLGEYDNDGKYQINLDNILLKGHAYRNSLIEGLKVANLILDDDLYYVPKDLINEKYENNEDFSNRVNDFIFNITTLKSAASIDGDWFDDDLAKDLIGMFIIFHIIDTYKDFKLDKLEYIQSRLMIADSFYFIYNLYEDSRVYDEFKEFFFTE